MKRTLGLNVLMMTGAAVCFLIAGPRDNSMAQEAAAPAGRLMPVPAIEDAPELALLMGDLQRLTHKLALSADAANSELVNFYLHESLEQLKTIQTEAPEYEGLPIAVLIDRMALPSYEPLKTAASGKPADRENMLKGLDAIIGNCNACHIATQHGFIRITRGTEINPFNQSFQP